MPPDLSEVLPLREPTFFILLSLARENKHGYAILKDVEQLSDQKVRLSTGTLYGALNRLLDQGLISRMDDEELSDSDEDGPGRPRKVYALTSEGRRVLKAEADRMSHLAKTAHWRLGEEAL